MLWAADVYLGALTLDVLLGDIRSLKQKRSAVASIIAEVRRRHPGVAVAETGSLDPTGGRRSAWRRWRPRRRT